MEPILFLLYINDIINSTENLSLALFADDTNVFYISKSLNELNETVNNELSNLSLWFRTNKLSLNIKKQISYCSLIRKKLTTA